MTKEEFTKEIPKISDVIYRVVSKFKIPGYDRSDLYQFILMKLWEKITQGKYVKIEGKEFGAFVNTYSHRFLCDLYDERCKKKKRRFKLIFENPNIPQSQGFWGISKSQNPLQQLILKEFIEIGQNYRDLSKGKKRMVRKNLIEKYYTETG